MEGIETSECWSFIYVYYEIIKNQGRCSFRENANAPGNNFFSKWQEWPGGAVRNYKNVAPGGILPEDMRMETVSV